MPWISEAIHYLLIFHVQLAIPLVMFSLQLPRRRNVPLWIPIALTVVYIVFPFIYRHFTVEEFWIFRGLCLFGWYYLTYIVYWLFGMAILLTSFQVTVRDALFYGIAAYCCQNFLFSVRSIIRLVFFSGIMTAGASAVGLLATLILHIWFYRHLVLKMKYHDDTAPLNNSTLIAFLLSALFVVNIFSQYWGYFTLNADHYTTDLYGTVFSAICGLTLLLLQFGVFDRTVLEREKEAMARMVREMERQQQASAYNIETINRKCHDLKHQISAMRSMDADEKNESLKELEQAVMIYDRTFQTGNQTLDTLLTEKSLICGQENISFSCIADAAGLDFMSKLDIYTLFGNALDNAFECVRQYPDPTQRQVALRIGRQGAIVSIRLENFCDTSLTFESGLPHSTKGDDENHGFGTRSIQNIVEKYGGSMRMSQADDTFTLDILFMRQE